ncbi:MAG TPA: AAA family ATPase [Sedimentisphaerales bacterium]|nr:AAA family ATPase [Sedimentisphaerales bacterium]HQA89132.1 AAA family ATPase [Sedimentisphaerales bacterium]
MFTEKAQAIVSMAKDRAYTLGRNCIDVESLLAAVAADREACVRLAECLTDGNVADLRHRCPSSESPGSCPGTMPPDEAVRLLLDKACELAGGEGVPDRTHPGLVGLPHLICAAAMSVEVASLLGDPIAPIGSKQAMRLLARWVMDSESATGGLGELTSQLRGLRAALLARVFGQDHAVHALVEGLYNAQVTAGADHDRRQPIATFVFAGPPGVGKTHMAELCAAHLKRPFKRFDMTAYSDHQADNQLVGFAPSFQAAKPGLLTGFVKQNPNAILLFDEIEKAHLNTMQLFYQILDAGRLHDKFDDEDVCFRDTIIIFTTNAGRSLYENPNASGISAVNADYHKRTILSALANEKNPTTGQPAFPPAICSRLGQGYPLMFNHLGINELERIAETEMTRTEALLERQYFKTFRHDPILPILLVLRCGASIDARQLRSEVERFVKSELFKFCSLYESQRVEKVLEQIDEVLFTVDPAEIQNHPATQKLLFNPDKSTVLLVADEAFASRCRQAHPEFEWISAATKEEVVSQLTAHEVNVILLDLWVSTGHDRAGAGANDYSPLPSAGRIDHLPLSARAFDNGRTILQTIRKRFSDVPVYLLSFQTQQADGTTKTVCVDDRYDVNERPHDAKRPRPIDEELFLACVRAGGARGMIATEYDRSSKTDPGAPGFAAALQGILLRLFREKVAADLARQRQCLEFDTVARLNESARHLGIWTRGFRLQRVIEAEDVVGLVSDVERPSTRFDEVFGATAAKKSLGFVVDWLKNRKRYAGLGLRPPKGILLSGPPGTGKTMLARAVAGESNCAFMEESGGNFITKWQGSGPENVRKLFQRARKYAPAIVFIDEIDAVGKTRSGATTSESRETTLNTLLTEMDGFGATADAPVIVLAATNLAEKLDPALKRRFDREIRVDEPDRSARLAYLQQAIGKLSKSEVGAETLEAIANQSVYMTIADLARIVQEAGVMAALAGSTITDSILLEAFEKQRMGEALPCTNQTKLLRIARHEAGHTLVAWKSGTPVHQVTIVGRGGAGGYMERKHDDDRDLQTKEDLLRDIRISMAGRAAELVCYGPDAGLSIGVGAPRAIGGGGGDLPNASQRAIQMVRVYGMDEEIGQLALDELSVENSQRPLAEQTLMLAERIVSEQLDVARRLIETHRDEFDRLVDALVKHNRLDEAQLTELLGRQPSPFPEVSLVP